ncbi:WD repeat-containing protein 44 [Schistocerca cancellata]|uniref:WD repeat-containing protein 44 n=1 Tax=Schistocerca cancellata TaxID=274614 RepID=UPI0021182BFE|nr:WD repeat-containing protein 44 [Schistocerca cancellata]
MSVSSDSEEFYDAEDLTPSRQSRKIKSTKEDDVIPRSDSEGSVFAAEVKRNSTTEETASSRKLSRSVPNDECQQIPEKDDLERKVLESHQGRKRFRELRQRMQTEDEDIGPSNTSPPDSQTSSIEGVFAVPPKTLHPFRIIEHDALSLQSMTSLGRVGRILAGFVDATGVGREGLQSGAGSGVHSSGFSLGREESMSETSSLLSQGSHTHISVNTERRMGAAGKAGSAPSLTTSASQHFPREERQGSLPLQEPDVIASTKGNGKISDVKTADSVAVPVPVAPPRRKKKAKAQAPKTLSPPNTEDKCLPPPPLPSPASTIESLTREFEHSLDIRSATKGQYVVKPQDEERAKAEGPSQEEKERLEKLKAELTGARTLSCPSPAGSLGSRQASHVATPRGSRERRRSAGDERGVMSQLNMIVRTRTDSGKQLSDLEILEQVTVLNLDTGERVPLSIAEDKLPQCINPLSLHIMRLTSEYVSNSSLEKEKESDEESVDSKKSSIPPEDADVSKMRKRTAQLKKFLGSKVRKTMDKAKSIAQEVSHARHKEDVMDIVDEVNPGEQYIKLKASGSHKGPYEFDSLQHVQDLSGEHVGPVWCMKFSSCGRLLATAGQDRVLRIWVVRSAYTYFQDMRTKYNAEKVSPTPSQESLVSQHSSEDPNAAFADMKNEEVKRCPFMPKPFCTYTGHTSDLLDVSWSKNYFVLSSSMDKTVRLWHISRKECLVCFQHIDFVTAIVFHPRDDRYFLSGSLDGKLRLWNIPDKKVAVWNELDGQTKLITAANFCQNGKFAVVGSYDGRCIFYTTEQLKYHTQIDVRSTRGKNSRGRKISGIEPMPGEDKILVTSNDSRIRLYDLRDLNLSCKYKGYVNVSSQIRASFSHDGKYIVSGSENQCIYIWKTHHDYSKFSSVRRDRNDFWEGIKAHNAVVTCAIFAPNPDIIIRQIEEQEGTLASQNLKVEDPLVEQHTKGCGGYVLVSADFSGCIKVFLNKMKPKHSSLPASALV